MCECLIPVVFFLIMPDIENADYLEILINLIDTPPTPLIRIHKSSPLRVSTTVQANTIYRDVMIIT